MAGHRDLMNLQERSSVGNSLWVVKTEDGESYGRYFLHTLLRYIHWSEEGYAIALSLTLRTCRRLTIFPRVWGYGPCHGQLLTTIHIHLQFSTFRASSAPHNCELATWSPNTWPCQRITTSIHFLLLEENNFIYVSFYNSLLEGKPWAFYSLSYVLFILCSVLGLLTKDSSHLQKTFKPEHIVFRLAIDKIHITMNRNKYQSNFCL